MAAAERIFSLMDVEANVKDLGTKEIHSPKGDITIKNLNFSYEERVPIFQDFNLHIKAGERIAIVGHTGAGKSSLISLISRFYEYQGEILIDGVDIKEYTLKSYRSLLGLVVQESFLFSGTIESNIRYGMKDASTEDVVKAAKMANAFEFIENMPKGMNFEVLEGGKKLSQGQKQLISLARVFLIDPKILLFDEATASIDAYSEALIQDAIERILKNRTSIVVAHRLTTIQRVDRIIVLDNGEIIEEGSHDDLMLKRGAYASIYDKYFSFQEIDPSLLDAIED
ncbi:MAG: ATP-binding cassette domain-containing protein [Candidatus Heimdallarchaeota archaeon]|nr:ATP-binding cassette domain-containing protein [Candidatus Heimdallarchaeota archaeon]